jgi:hypothetical protein
MLLMAGVMFSCKALINRRYLKPGLSLAATAAAAAAVSCCAGACYVHAADGWGHVLLQGAHQQVLPEARTHLPLLLLPLLLLPCSVQVLVICMLLMVAVMFSCKALPEARTHLPLLLLLLLCRCLLCACC